MKFLPEIFQDIDGGYSAKRTAFFLFIVVFIVLTLAVFAHAIPDARIPVIQSSQDKLVDLIKWIGAFIAGEQLTKFAPSKPA